ncbi:hypothetical protein ACH3Y5_16255 [Brucella melitensis]|uniref:hypothetical protein n=1 Tax=Brucella melitensis TaxID=29459 RepID=UPI003891AA60
MTTTNKREQTAIEASIAKHGDGSHVLSLVFATGDTLTIRGGDLTEVIREQAIMHGLKQKLVDAAAIKRNEDTGASATVADKYQAVKKVYDRLLSGEWNAIRGEGEGASGSSLLFRALTRLYANKTPAEIRTMIEGWDKKQQAAVRANPKVAPIIAAIKAEDEERAAKTSGVDSNELLAGLGDLPEAPL